MKRIFRCVMLVFAVVSVGGVVTAQKKSGSGSLRCLDSMSSDRLKVHCEIKEQTLLPGGVISVDGRRNGGVQIKGWDRNEVLVRSQIQTAAPTVAEAEQLANEIRVDTSGFHIRAEGPEERDDLHWFVSYEIFVPRRSDLSLQAGNGGISVGDVHGRIDFKTTNGGVNLVRVGGAVRGNTTNGGVNVVLDGVRWDGEMLDVKTTNGGVNLLVPENYSAHLETGTVNGNISVNIQLNVALTDRVRRPKEINVDLGSGGPTVRAMTTNGGVRIGKSSVVE